MPHLLEATEIYEQILQATNGKITASVIRQIHDAWAIFGALVIDTQQTQILTGLTEKFDIWESVGESHNLDVDLPNNRMVIEESSTMMAFLQLSFGHSQVGDVLWDFEIRKNGVAVPGGHIFRRITNAAEVGSASCATIFVASKDDVIEVFATNDDSPPISLVVESAQLLLVRV